MKIRCIRLQFEITRRCNQKCIHCCRGKCQNVDLTKEIVDSFFDDNDIDYIGTLMFSGGEPTLNAVMVKYIVDKIIEKKIEVGNFITSINGLIYSPSFGLAIDKLNSYLTRDNRDDRCGTFFISSTQFHQPPSIEAINGYLQFITFVPYKGINPIDVNNLEPYGNAILNGLTDKKPDINSVTDYVNNFRAVEYQGQTYMVINKMYISSNGNILMNGCLSYDLMDSLKVGNVKDGKLEDFFMNEKIRHK